MSLGWRVFEFHVTPIDLLQQCNEPLIPFLFGMNIQQTVLKRFPAFSLTLIVIEEVRVRFRGLLNHDHFA